MSFGSDFNKQFSPIDDAQAELDAALSKKCKDCPVQCGISSNLAIAIEEEAMAKHRASLLIGESGDAINEYIDDSFPEEDANAAKYDLRKLAAAVLEEVDGEIEGLKNVVKALESTCNGPLKMRATKDGQVYTVAVCTSSEVYASGENHTPAHITRKDQ